MYEIYDPQIGRTSRVVKSSTLVYKKVRLVSRSEKKATRVFSTLKYLISKLGMYVQFGGHSGTPFPCQMGREFTHTGIFVVDKVLGKLWTLFWYIWLTPRLGIDKIFAKIF